MALTIANGTGGVNSVIVAGATVAAPAANTLIVDSGLLAANPNQEAYYLFSVITGQTGTPDANTTNILVNVGGTNTAGVISAGTTYGPLTSLSAANSGGSPQLFRLAIPRGGAHVFLCTGNTAGGAGAVYNAGMVITRLTSSSGWYF